MASSVIGVLAGMAVWRLINTDLGWWVMEHAMPRCVERWLKCPFCSGFWFSLGGIMVTRSVGSYAMAEFALPAIAWATLATFFWRASGVEDLD